MRVPLTVSIFCVLAIHPACATAAPELTPNIPATVTAQVRVELASPSTPIPINTTTPKPTNPPTPTASPTITPLVSNNTETDAGALERTPIGDVSDTGQFEVFEGQAGVLNREATEMLNRGEYAAANANLKKIEVLLDEPSYVLHYRLGLAYRWHRDLDSSIRHFSIAIDLDDTSTSRANRATSYLYNNQCPEAIKDSNLALDIESTPLATGYSPHVEVLLLLSHCYSQGGDNTLALAQIEKTIDLAPLTGVSDERFESFARVKKQIEDISEGRAYPEDMFAGFVLIDINEGMAKFYGGQERAAIELFTSALEGHGKPSNRILNLLARSHSDLGQHEEAVGYFTEAIGVRVDSFNRTWRAMQYFGNEDCDLAFADADKALGTNPYVETGFDTRVQSLLIRGHCGGFQGQAKKAVADIGEAIRLAPNSDYSQEEIDYLRGEHQAWLQVAIEDRGGSP